MSRYIDADAFEVFEYELVGGSSEYRDGFDDGVEYVLGRIDNVPTVDVKPVVKAKWFDDFSSDWVCTNCMQPSPSKRYNYCPNCGAEMGMNK